MERIFKDYQLSFFKDDLWNNNVAKRSEIMTPLFLERYCGAHNSALMSSHDYWEFSANISGTGTLITESKLQIIPEMVFLIPPGVAHRESSRQELDIIWLGFAGELPGISREKVLSLKSPEMVKRIISYWLFSVRNHGPIGPELDGILLSLTGYFFRKLADNRTGPPMQQAVEYFNEHFQEPVSMSELAEMLNCSEGHFYRQFKEFTGKTPICFLNDIRLKKAAFYLQHSQLPIHKIANLCGFSDPYYFSRAFSKKNKLSPSQYRKNNSHLSYIDSQPGR
jgi:AraC-like DNA-binding protein